MKNAFLAPGSSAVETSNNDLNEQGRGRLSPERAKRQVQDLEGGFRRVASVAQQEALEAGVGYTTIVHGVRVKITPE